MPKDKSSGSCQDLLEYLQILESFVNIKKKDIMLKIANLIHKFPGEKWFGFYRFLPIFFLSGAGLELTMIKWEFNGVNFYKTYKRRQAEEIVAQEIRLKQELS
ncbi:hypothetical protein JTE90_029176 [Oedothorax gibbosus]|uniref:Uncharacterized protein n=1 Tax=Oedothorax gibbosus TaxID=931172 RepID=A0AAV6VG16_9ARAC|nr:hypothetical protein JTE90_029176 [Oedothorax gibbosus]